MNVKASKLPYKLMTLLEAKITVEHYLLRPRFMMMFLIQLFSKSIRKM